MIFRQIVFLIIAIITASDHAYSQNKYLSYKLTEKAEPLAMINVLPSQSKNIDKIALFLQQMIQQSTGAKLPLRNDIPTKMINQFPVVIHLNTINKINKKIYHLLESDGFQIDFKDKNNIWIQGNSENGTEFGVYEFLERFLNIRWLFPGPLGEHIPKIESLEITGQNISQSPVFFSRGMSGLRGEDSRKWLRIHRMHLQIRHHHNLHNIFSVDPYLKSHPHLYPQKNGQPHVPNPITGWQPCFYKKDAIEIAVANISDYFEKNPLVDTFSLGPNDAISSTSGYCFLYESSIGYNSWGYPDASNMYFSWANNVVQQILDRYPCKLFGTIAYMELAMPPQLTAVHQNIIPFLTEDRMRWVLPKYKSFAQQWVESWAKKSRFIGFYDYIYGTPYVLPRVYFHQMAETYRYAAQKGVKTIYAEAYPNWGEGPKLYIAAKLFWNPFLDVDHLLNEWYEICVGKKAAPYIAEYYKLWETFWTQKVQNSKWFYNESMYMAFWSPAYLDICDISDIRKSRMLLEKAIDLSDTNIQKRRARLLLMTFEYYEATAISYWGLKTKSFNINKNHADLMNKKRYELMKLFQDDSLLNHPLRFDNKQRFPKLNWTN